MTKAVVRRKSAGSNQRHPLEEYIPDAYLAEEYVSREVHGVPDAKVLDKAAGLMHNVIISGPTGSAKTSLVYAFAAGFIGGSVRRKNPETKQFEIVNEVLPEHRRPLIYVPCNGAITPDQLFGGWVPTDDGSFAFVPGELTLAVIHGGIIYLDEVNFMAIKIAAVAHGLLDKRRTIIVKDARGAGLCNKCGVVNGSASYVKRTSPTEPLFVCGGCGEENYTDTVFPAHEDTFIVAAYNPGYRGTNPLNEAFLNRFAFKIKFPYERAIEEQMLYSGKLIDMAFAFRASYANGEITTPVSTSMLIEFETIALDPDLGLGFAIENFLNAFTDDERPSAQKVVELHAAAIKSELEDDEEEDDDDLGLPDDEDLDDQDDY